MPGEKYYLFLLTKEGQLLRVYNKPMTIKAIDERTIKYKDKNALVKEILKNTKLDFKKEDIADVILMMQPNSKKQEFKNEFGPLYSEDRNVLNTDMISAEFEMKVRDPKFVLYYIKPYLKVKNLRATVNLIYALIESNENYYEELQSIVDKVSSSYKGCRNIYLAMKFYDKEKNAAAKGKIKFRTKEEPIYQPTDEEIERNQLEYLKEFDRESLDISDFDDYGELSPFDGSGKSK